MKNVKLLLAASLLAPAVLGGQAHATPGDHSVTDAVNHYFGGPQSGESRVTAVIAANITNYTQLEADIARMTPTGVPACTRANSCIKVVGSTGSPTTNLPITDVAADRYKAALAIAAQHAGNTSAQLVLINCPDKTSTSFLNAGKVAQNVPALGIVGAQFLWGISLTDSNQTTLASWFDSHPIFVAAPKGLVKWSGRLEIGFSTYIGTNPDTTWAGFSGTNDLMMLGAQIKQVQDGSVVTQDSDALAPALAVALADAESGSIATRADFLASTAGLFSPLGSSTLGTVVAYGEP